MEMRLGPPGREDRDLLARPICFDGLENVLVDFDIQHYVDVEATDQGLPGRVPRLPCRWTPGRFAEMPD
jgi:hypothetical protein